MRLLTATLIWGAMVTLAQATPAQCTVTDYGQFDCDVALDGGGLTFNLPDGRTFAFTLTEKDRGVAFLIEADAKPGQPPQELHEFKAVDGKAGCWARNDAYEFCVLVAQ